MVFTAKPLKGILKKTASTPSAADDGDGDGGASDIDDSRSAIRASSATYSRRLRSEQDNAEIARKHAAILEQRRELETAIFQAIEQLTDFPRRRDAPCTSAHPSPEDAAAFTHLVRIFQPGDYDDLIEERNTCGHCGYALCPKPRQTFAGKGTWKLVNAGRKDFGIVAKNELEKWCSSACARRALYIKVQLNETAAWERIGIPDIRVELLEEKDGETKKDDKDVPNDTSTAAAANAEAHLAQDLARLRLGEERRLVQNAQVLAMERGDATTAGAADDASLLASSMIMADAPTTLVDVNVMEKTVTTVPTAPTLDQGDEDSSGPAAGDSHMVVEGHKSKFAGE